MNEHCGLRRIIPTLRSPTDALADFTAAVQAYRSQSAEFEKEAVKAETAGSLPKARARKAEAEDAMRRAEAVQQRVQAVMKPWRKTPKTACDIQH
jgi:hypothetical protein